MVEEVGKGVKDLKPGDHVVMAWVQPCGKCHFCVAGRGHLCEAGMQSAMAGEEFVFEKDGMPIAPHGRRRLVRRSHRRARVGGDQDPTRTCRSTAPVWSAAA